MMNGHRKRGNFGRQTPGPSRVGVNFNARQKRPFRSAVTKNAFAHPPPPPPPPVPRMAVSQSNQVATSEQTKQKTAPEVVRVPDASKFFSIAASTRSAILNTLNLNSLIEYVEHLEDYRKANWEKVATFQKQYQDLMMTQGKMGDPENAQLANGDIIGQRVFDLLEDVEAKLEAFQLKRMLSKGIDGVHNFDLGSGQSAAEKQPTVVDLTFREEIVPMNQRKQENIVFAENEPNASKKMAKLAPIFEEDKLVEDFSGTLDSLLNSDKGSLDEGEDDESQEEEDLQIKFDSVPVAEEQSLSDDSGALKLVEETLEKVTKSLADEVSLEKSEQEKKSTASSVGKLTTPQVTIPLAKSLKATLSIEGHQLPIQRDFNCLSPVEQNFVLVPLPEEIRASYLNLIWEARFYEHLASKPIHLKQQLLLSLQK